MNRIAARKEMGIPEPASQRQSLHWWDWRLWLQWIAANAAGEVLGLGLAAAVGVGMILGIGEPKSLLAAVMMAGVMIAAGACEGIIVGLAQWLVLRRRLARLQRRDWVLATAMGSLIAWTLGMAPSTLAVLNQDASAPTPEPSDLQVYVLAAAMGAVLGVVLGIPQWRVLRRHVQRAHWWVWANAAAWVAGMPLVFLGAGSSPVGAPPWTVALMIALTIAAAGATVGAIHGAALLWLLDSPGSACGSRAVASAREPRALQGIFRRRPVNDEDDLSRSCPCRIT
jgi:hypothetical protein